MTCIVQLTDTHLVADGGPAYGRVDTLAGLRRAVGHIDAQRRFFGAVDAVVVSGDLTDHGEPDAYARFRESVAPLAAPLFVIPGNHDAREPMRAAFVADGCAPPEGPLDFCADGGGLRLIGLDTLVEGEAHGAVSPAQVAWLDARLAETQGGPALLFLHHPPFATGIDFMDAVCLRDAEALAAVVARHDALRLVSCGHVHRSVFTRWAGRPAMVAPAPSHAVALALRPQSDPHFAMEPGAVTIHHLGADGAVTSHVSVICPDERSFPF